MNMRHIDFLIGKHLFGLNIRRNDGNMIFTANREWVPDGDYYYDCEKTGTYILPSYSTDMSAAWKVVEYMTDMDNPQRCTFDMRRITDWHNPMWGYDVRFGEQHNPTHQPERVAWVATAPLAICLSALRALGVDLEQQTH